MTKQEYLLQKLQEECAEVIQAASKINRFGLDEFSPFDETKTTNQHKLTGEIIGLQVIISMVGNEGLLIPMNGKEVGAAMEAEQAKVERFMEVSRELGTLDKEPEEQEQPQD